MCRWGDLEFPLPFGRVLSSTESFIQDLDDKVSKFETIPPFLILSFFSPHEVRITIFPNVLVT
jgi:hypothetical protein